MKRLRLIIAVISLVLIILIVSAVLFLKSVGTSSLPQESGKEIISGIGTTVKIERDSSGVPYIYAMSDSDAYFALGFVHAQDRLFQMEMYRRLGEGRLSEIFGPSTVDIDRLFRTLRFNEMAESLLVSISPESRNILHWYSRGVNAYLKSAKALPVEFAFLKFQPEKWRPLDCVVVARLMAWELNLSWWAKPVFGEIYSKFGEKTASVLIPDFNGQAAAGIDHNKNTIRKAGSMGYPLNNEQLLKMSVNQLDGFFSANVHAYEFLFGSRSIGGIGSNNWVVSGRKTNTSSAILCNDPHLAFSEPMKWYMAVIHTPDMDVMGVTLSGAPGIIIGRNRDIAWGMTNVMADDADFLVERVDSVDNNFYWYDGKRFPFDVKTDTVFVRDSGRVVFQKKLTVHGPVVSDVINSSYGLTAVGKLPGNAGEVVTIKWSAYFPSDEVKAIHLLGIARTFHDFTNALQFFGAPAQNFVYADVKGNIGYKAAGNIPLRRYLHPFLPQDGSNTNYSWSTFIPYDELPTGYNPDSGFIATANNRTVNNYPYYITNLYEPSSRIERINSFIKSHEPMSVELCRELQDDYYSPFFVSLNARLIKSCDSLRYLPAELVYLRNFDGFIGPKSTAASILNVFFVKFLREVFVPVLGEDLYKKYSLLSNIPTRVIEGIIKDPTRLSYLYDTQNGDSLLSFKMVNSLRESLRFLRDHFGPHPSRWQWGKLHELELKHFLSKNSLIRRLYNLGPFERGGSNTTVNNGEYSLTNPFEMIIGPSMRMIVVMNEQGMYLSFPGGESGQLLSPHYRDMLHDYLSGKVKYFPLDLEENHAENILKLVPEK